MLWLMHIMQKHKQLMSASSIPRRATAADILGGFSAVKHPQSEENGLQSLYDEAEEKRRELRSRIDVTTGLVSAASETSLQRDQSKPWQRSE